MSFDQHCFGSWKLFSGEIREFFFSWVPCLLLDCLYPLITGGESPGRTSTSAVNHDRAARHLYPCIWQSGWVEVSYSTDWVPLSIIFPDVLSACCYGDVGFQHSLFSFCFFAGFCFVSWTWKLKQFECILWRLLAVFFSTVLQSKSLNGKFLIVINTEILHTQSIRKSRKLKLWLSLRIKFAKEHGQ